jgi:hypothetical protein
MIAAPVYAEGPDMQPDLKKQLEDAPLVEPEELGAVVKTVTAYQSHPLVPNPDGKSYDVLLWYYREYPGPTWLYAVDLGTGQVHRQEFPLKRQLHIAGQTLGLDGKYYIATPYGWSYGTRKDAADQGVAAGMELIVYDPATNVLTNRGVIVPGLFGERRPLAVGPDGTLYGGGTYYEDRKVGVYSYDPATGEVREYGAVGPRHRGGAWTNYNMFADETHIYTVSGMTPNYLVAVNIETGEDTVLLQTEPGGEMRLRSDASVDVQETKDGVVRKYWLYNGKAVPRTDDTPPWPVRNWPTPQMPPKPELHLEDRYPDANGRARLWHRPVDADQAEDDTGDAEPGTSGWKAIELEGIETYPQRINLLAGLPDGRVFCKAQPHFGGSIYNPGTGEIDAFGDGPTEAYDCLVHEGNIFWTGYSSGRTCVYDPSRPWTLTKGVPPGREPANIRDKATNPRQLALFHEHKVSQMLSAVVGADNVLYLCGWGVRAYKGGAFCWVDLATEVSGATWERFVAYRTYWLATALDRRLIVVSSAATSDELNNWEEAPEGKLFVYDTRTSEFVREIVPVPRSRKTGPILEVEPGLMMGIADDPDEKYGGILYKLDVRSGKVLFRKKLPYAAPVPDTHTTALCGYRLGPDGNIWTFLGRGDRAQGEADTLVRIDREGHVEPVCRLEQLGDFIFVGNDMYLSGTHQLRRIQGIGAGSARR